MRSELDRDREPFLHRARLIEHRRVKREPHLPGTLRLPSHSVPQGAWLLLAGMILLGASVLRYVTRLRVSAFIVALGLLAVVAGISAIAGMDLPLFAAFLVLLGASIMLRSWFAPTET